MSTATRSGQFREVEIDETIVTESKAGARLSTAKVGHVDRATLNGRLYPREVWQANIDRLEPLLAQGRLTGAVDHLGKLDSGNLSASPIVWRHLEIAADGSVMGKYEIVESHSKGKDLKAQKDAGMAIGFSTFGRGSWHAPSQSEGEKYGLADGTDVVIMDANFVLSKIDAVDDPACADAWSVGERVEANDGEPTSSDLAALAQWSKEFSERDSAFQADGSDPELAPSIAVVDAYMRDRHARRSA